jgi:hypothetical protein
MFTINEINTPDEWRVGNNEEKKNTGKICFDI